MSSVNKAKRKSLSLSDKLKIISKLQSGRANAQICLEHGLSKSTVSTIWAQRNKYFDAQTRTSLAVKKIREPERKDVDKALLKWFSLQRSQNVPVSGIALQEKADQFARLSHSIQEEAVSSNPEGFNCTTGWIDRFKKRHDIHSGKNHGEAGDVSSEITNNWLTTIWPGLRRRYSDKDIFNGDETGLFYKMTPDRTLKFKGEKCSGGKLSKERITAWVCANMDGSEKKKLLIIGKSKSPRCFKNQHRLPIIYKANKKAWMTSDIFTELLRTWDNELEKNNRKILLIIDNCPAHPKIENLQWIELVFLPPNVTATLQPMDQGVIRSVKSHYRRQLLLKLIDAHDKKVEFKISLLEAILMFNTAWRNVSQKTISNCFKHAGFSVEKGYTDEDKLPLAQWILIQNKEETELDLNEWTKNQNIFDFEKINLNDYAMIDEHVEVAEFPNDIDIVQMTANDKNENDSSDEEIDRNDEVLTPTAQEALSALKIVAHYVQIMYPENEKCLNATDLLQNKISEEMLKNRKVQSQITDFFCK